MTRPDPLLIQVHARLVLQALGATLRRPATLDDIPDGALDFLATCGADFIYLLGVWRLGEAGPAISRADPAIVAEAHATLPDATPQDIAGSAFALVGYEVAPEFGGDEALARLRRRLAARRVGLLLDFVPNHTAPDHPWVTTAPDLYVNATEDALAADPRNWRRVQTAHGERIIALGRDPYFDGWPDTLQLDYANPRTQTLMAEALASIATRADGVRCDMAMLVLPDIVRRTWHREAADFWPDAIARARAANPGFTLIAEVYWGLERALLERGFDFAYDKPLYDALVARDPVRIRAFLSAPVDAQRHLARFLENHDERRAASVFSWPERRAATAIVLLAPGLRFLHAGQSEGAKIFVSMHLARGPVEPADPESLAFHGRLLAILPRGAPFVCLDPQPAWPGNSSHESFVTFLWQTPKPLLVAVNIHPERAQARVRLDLPHLDQAGGTWQLTDLLGPERYDRPAHEMRDPGLFLELPAWGLNVFEFSPPE